MIWSSTLLVVTIDMPQYNQIAVLLTANNNQSAMMLCMMYAIAMALLLKDHLVDDVGKLDG